MTGLPTTHLPSALPDAAALRGRVSTPPRPRFTGLRLLIHNDDAWQAKRHLIAKARRTLDLSYFILEIDGTTSRLLLDLVEAAERGVKVRLLVDYFLTFQQAAALRALAGVRNIEVRRYGPPRPAWLAALDAAGIDHNGFVKGLMATDGAKLVEALKGNTIFPPAVVAQSLATHPVPDKDPAQFSKQVLSALQNAAPAPPAGLSTDSVSPNPGIDRKTVLTKVALVIEILRGLKQFLHRTHHKLLLADGTWFMMGGRNLADAYHCQAPPEGRAFQDTDLFGRDRRAGGSGHLATFEVLWNGPRTVAISEADPLDERPAVPMTTFNEVARAASPIRPGATFRRGIRLPDMDGRLVDNLPSDKGDASITRAYVDAIGQMTAGGRPGSIDVVTAYLFLGDEVDEGASLIALREAFLAAARAGQAVNIYTNSLLTTDLKPVNRAAYPKLVELIDADVGIFELDDGQGSLHTKSAAIGDACLFVGSYNMDPRSELYDTNNLIVLQDASGAATAAFRQGRIGSLKWTRLTVEAVRQRAAETNDTPVARLTFGQL